LRFIQIGFIAASALILTYEEQALTEFNAHPTTFRLPWHITIPRIDRPAAPHASQQTLFTEQMMISANVCCHNSSNKLQ